MLRRIAGPRRKLQDDCISRAKRATKVVEDKERKAGVLFGGRDLATQMETVPDMSQLFRTSVGRHERRNAEIILGGVSNPEVLSSARSDFVRGLLRGGMTTVVIQGGGLRPGVLCKTQAAVLVYFCCRGC